MISYIFNFALVFLFVFQARVIYLIFVKNGRIPRKRSCLQPAKTLIILGSGGHTTEMLHIIAQLNWHNYSPRIYVHARTDKISVAKVRQLEREKIDYKIFEISRSREVCQSYYTSVWTTIVAILNSLPIMWREKPDLILCNGPGTCIPLCLVAFFFKIFFISNVKITFIESFCRVKTYSLTGKILYYIADFVIVQWANLSKPMYNRKTMQNIAPVTTESILWQSFLKDLQENSPPEIKVHLIPVLTAVRSSCETNENLSLEWVENSLTRLEGCLDRIWEALNSGYWKHVPIQYRRCYSFCSVLISILLEIQCANSIEISLDTRMERLREIVEVIDKGILLGAPIPSAPHLLTTIASRLNDIINIGTISKTDNTRETLIEVKETFKVLLPGFTLVNRYRAPSMETFYRDIFTPKVPALLEGCMEHWKALRAWQNSKYLMRVAGIRTVPIEIGSRYTEEDWSQRLVTFSEFLNAYIATKSSEVGYLAQHQLFEQIPELKEDFVTPDYCNFSDNNEEDATTPDVNAWFGPSGTVTPLHFDPKNNLLCQVFGHKRIILYHPNDSENLYPYETRLLSNTAQVDPEHPDLKKWPNFKAAKGILCHLGPGDMLYIPPKWWHHVLALTQSFSVSFWWN